MRWRQDPADKGRLLSGLPGPTKYSFCRVQWVDDTVPKGGSSRSPFSVLAGFLLTEKPFSESLLFYPGVHLFKLSGTAAKTRESKEVFVTRPSSN